MTDYLLVGLMISGLLICGINYVGLMMFQIISNGLFLDD